ncbi:hypothetical protein I4O84_005950 [Clostridioides difficile]
MIKIKNLIKKFIYLRMKSVMDVLDLIIVCQPDVNPSIKGNR